MKNIRDYFPILQRTLGDNKLIYLDNASTSQKPQEVIEAMSHYYAQWNANAKRGIYSLAEETSRLYEEARLTVANFINARAHELIFTSGTTDGINFVADAWGMKSIHKDDEIVVTELEHHSNFLPWQRLAQRTGAMLTIVPVDASGMIHEQAFDALITSRTKLVAVTGQSNVTGAIPNLPRIIKRAHAVGARVLIDAAQLAAHRKIDVQALEPDFLVFSAHKMFGPTAIGALFIRQEVQQEVEPYQLGGGMVFDVGYARSRFLDSPYKFEAGTPKIAEAIGYAQAIKFISQNVNFDEFEKQSSAMAAYLVEALEHMTGFSLVGDRAHAMQSCMVSFYHNTIHAHDIAAHLDQYGICVRAGNHCTQLFHKKMGINSSVRVSFAPYTTIEEIIMLVEALKKL